ncbi:uncharacterized protein BO87DRAFT_375573 [Aspergillus neoniger CBS 115656]|uniref:Uncharacterized protein n=1 Tax=Aspergillus neoniger (strain CBS 115656) TaxID=1448310 RepID=A0A318YME7_ASPNB|nr:hypothetical protein BO87DRAFT_375573 [Aspergillus neoniger CBS 115656]PYH35396.1 hypothetical protein BO87DRAFT_375573 [Aspergillus neoniger CBS 115656]
MGTVRTGWVIGIPSANKLQAALFSKSFYLTDICVVTMANYWLIRRGFFSARSDQGDDSSSTK